MPVKLGLAAGNGFLALALRRIARGSSDLLLVREARRPDEAAALLVEPGLQVIVMAGTLLPEGGEILRQALAAARVPVVLVGGEASTGSGSTGGRVRRVDIAGTAGEQELGALRARVLTAIGDAASEAAGAHPVPRSAPRRFAPEIVLIGSSTGGPAVLQTILGRLSRPLLPIVIAQHMVADQTADFARHLAATTGLQVACRGSGPVPEGACVTLLPGGADWRLDTGSGDGGGGLRLRPADVPGNHFHPCVDALFSSAAALGLRAAAVVLTGMGRDGADGARRLAETGAPVLVQALPTCAVPGMPAAALAVAPDAESLAPAAIAGRIDAWAQAAARAPVAT